MAERSGELKSLEQLDPVSTPAGAGGGKALEEYSKAEEFTPGSITGDAPEETEQIRASIEETRSQMGETIDAIQEKLSFANISEQVSETVNNAIETAKDTAYDATIGKAVNFMKHIGDGVTHSGALKTVTKNPVPFALIGIGAGLLAYQSFGRSSSRKSYGYGNGAGFTSGSGGNGESTFDSAKQSIGDATSRVYDGISDKAGAALESVTSAAGSAYEGVTGAVSDVYTGAGEFANRAYDRAGNYGTVAHEKYDEYLEENPLALGAIALAVGAAVGFAIPSTYYEGKLMGEARETLVQKAQDAAGSLVDKAKQVATEAGETIKHEAQALTQ